MSSATAFLIAIFSSILIIWVTSYTFYNVETWAQLPVVLTSFLLIIVILAFFIAYSTTKGKE